MKKIKLLCKILIFISMSFTINVYAAPVEDGNYTVTSALSNNRVIDLQAGNAANYSNVRLYTYNGSNAQIWNFSKQQDQEGENKEEYYLIKSAVNNNFCLDVTAGNFANKSNVRLFKCNNTKAQKWKLTEDSQGYYTIMSYDNNYVLDISGASIANGTNIQLYKSNNTKAQKFALNKNITGTKTIEDGYYNITSFDGNYYVNRDNIIENGTNIKFVSNANEASKWYIKYLNNGFYSIAPAERNNYSFEVAGNGKLRNSNVSLYKSNNTVAQYWVIKDQGEGAYSIISRGNGLSLDAENSNIGNNHNIVVNHESDSNTQKFKFTKAENKGTQTIKDGYYFINSKVNYKKSIEVTSGQMVENRNVQLYDSNSTIAQRWYVKYLGDGYYRISNAKNTTFALTSDSLNSSNIKINTFNNLDTQKWIIKDNNNGYYTIMNKSFLSVDIVGASMVNGTNIRTYSNNETDAQQFKFTPTTSYVSDHPVANGYYYINSAIDDNYVLEISGGSTANGANIQLYKSNATKAQKWYLTYYGAGYYTITSGLDKTKSFDVAGASTSSGANVCSYNFNKSYAQQWVLKDAGDGSFYILSNCNGLALDVHGGKATNFANIETNNYTGNTSQKFKLTKTRLENLVIDISAHNGDINWDVVKRDGGIYGVILRVAAGSAAYDTKLEKNIAALKRLNVPYGIYLYSYAENKMGTVSVFGTHHEAKLEAMRILKAIEDYDLNPTLGVYYDLEVWEPYHQNAHWDSSYYAKLINNFDSVMSKTKYKDWKIYANLSMANGVLSPWRSRITWVAQWNNTCSYTGYYNLWQFTNSGSIPGISTRVDLNYYYLD